MTSTGTTLTLAERVPADPTDPDALYEAFVGWAADQGLALYPAQDEALLELVTGSHVILSTPTGSGKSLVAMAAHFVALAQGRRTYYTAPLKALVSEKFFDLVRAFGSQNVGMMTGDSAVNPTAPILCCTAEILANVALRTGGGATHEPGRRDDPAVPGADAVGQVVMDEFHFYADPQRGWAWQVPLLELPRTQFLLMSATLGEVDFFTEDLRRRTGREVAAVTSAERPVPLTFSYVVEPLHEVVEELVQTRRAPVYLVHFTQRDAVERAQALLSTTVASRQQRDEIAAELGSFGFGTGFGKTLSKLLRHGVGVHHAGMLPRYRRLVERLTQKGLLTVVCGTDTLGVGINVPIRTVVMTSLVKYDGVRMRHLTAREFHQIAGRAGRAGYDTLGEVLVMAPDHVIENRKLLARAGDDPKKLKKIVRKKAPSGAVNWTDKTFERLRDAAPEPLTSSFAVTHAMVLNVLARQDTDPVAAMTRLLTDNHEPDAARSLHLRQAVRIYRSLRTAGVVERVRRPDGAGWTVRTTVDVPQDFALNQPLSPFAYAALEVLDREAPSYALDVVSVVESTLDDPRQVLVAQEKRARGEAIGAMKAEGYDYDERMAAIEDITYPRPLAELLDATFTIYRRANPWVADHVLSPKSVVRDMVEHAMTFTEYVSTYGLERTEGLLLRYLADAYRSLRQTVTPEWRNEELEDLLEWLGELVRGTDSSLLDEWERLSDPDAVATASTGDGDLGERPPVAITANRRAFKVLVRNALFRRVELAARERWGALGALKDVDADGAAWDTDRWHAALDPYFDEHEEMGLGPDARGPGLHQVTERTGPAGEVWEVRQVLDDPAGDRDWRIDAVVDLTASAERGEVVLRVTAAGRL
ncbi:DEAD/DEAH box helicase [Cellulomonas bogoriensis]|uniref:DEAD/DEAH box helicase n=1 Tax=Cellulomonas bogoriensis 69B4 = DSM 16987 TaxID=1386082 RepID=A0A0A0C2I6_9CELL|nr:DEAD/DEAH box helicase [Cellulomonas bogoriensis]KGM14390.1 DEAD/DEAH box helicase [Cellulomonas bogoriensis 69B4 = DSM 16987]